MELEPWTSLDCGCHCYLHYFHSSFLATSGRLLGCISRYALYQFYVYRSYLCYRYQYSGILPKLKIATFYSIILSVAVNNTVCLILLINQSIALLKMTLVYIG